MQPRSIRLGAERFEIIGTGEKDPYFDGLEDGVEPELDRVCRHILRSDDVCLDIGANIGITALVMSQHVPRGRVIAVEAAPGVCKALRWNVERSGKRNIVVDHAAVGDRDRTVAFNEHFAWGHIAEGVPPLGFQSVEVPMRRLGTILAEHRVERVAFIKIDVEGYEFPILRDALPLIALHRAVVYLEFNAFTQLGLVGLNPREIIEWLLASFPVIFAVRSQGGPFLKRIMPQARGVVDFLHMHLVEDRVVTNIVALHDERQMAELTG
jgi:FkbM family methyltransferase